jgi:hypothetical protein
LPLLLHINVRIDFYVCKRSPYRSIFAVPVAHQPPTLQAEADETRHSKPKLKSAPEIQNPELMVFPACEDEVHWQL